MLDPFTFSCVVVPLLGLWIDEDTAVDEQELRKQARLDAKREDLPVALALASPAQRYKLEKAAERGQENSRQNNSTCVPVAQPVTPEQSDGEETPAATLTLAKTVVAPWQPLDIFFSMSCPPGRDDFIGIYLATVPLDNIGEYEGSLFTRGRVRSSCTFIAPCKPDLYSLRLVHKDSKILGTIEFTVEVPGDSNYSSSSDSEEPITVGTDKVSLSSCKVAAPASALYYLDYFGGQTMVNAAKFP